MCTCVILLLLKLAANMLMNIILIVAEKKLNLTNFRIEMYPTEGPKLKTLARRRRRRARVACLKPLSTSLYRYTRVYPI
jgi:hypothetical protein